MTDLPSFPNLYASALDGIVELLEAARRRSVRAVNALMVATYWEVGRRIVELDQGGKAKAQYGEAVIEKLSADLSKRFGRGFSQRNLEYMRRFYVLRAHLARSTTSDAQSKGYEKAQTPSAPLSAPSSHFPLPWSHYVTLLHVANPNAREFYEREALAGGWSIVRAR